MFWNIVKWGVLIAVIAIIAWVGLSVYSCFVRQNPGQLDMPDQEEASYSISIENTGGLILTNDYEIHGTEVGSRVFILHGFWELRGQKFVYKDADIILDEAIFGEITLKRR